MIDNSAICYSLSRLGGRVADIGTRRRGSRAFCSLAPLLPSGRLRPSATGYGEGRGEGRGFSTCSDSRRRHPPLPPPPTPPPPPRGLEGGAAPPQRAAEMAAPLLGSPTA